MENSIGSLLSAEQRPYTLLNSGNFNQQYLNIARDVLGLADEGGIIFDGQLVRDGYEPPVRGELLLTRELTEEERSKLGTLGLTAIAGAFPVAT